MSEKQANKTKLIWGGILVLVIGLAIFSVVGVGGEHDEFATCLSERGAVMYGAFWCPHCADQKALFGRSAKHIEYIECSNPDRTQNAECTTVGISSYPTWQFGGGPLQPGVFSLEQLSSVTGCPL